MSAKSFFFLFHADEMQKSVEMSKIKVEKFPCKHSLDNSKRVSSSFELSERVFFVFLSVLSKNDFRPKA